MYIIEILVLNVLVVIILKIQVQQIVYSVPKAIILKQLVLAHVLFVQQVLFLTIIEQVAVNVHLVIIKMKLAHLNV